MHSVTIDNGNLPEPHLEITPVPMVLPATAGFDNSCCGLVKTEDARRVAKSSSA